MRRNLLACVRWVVHVEVDTGTFLAMLQVLSLPFSTIVADFSLT